VIKLMYGFAAIIYGGFPLWNLVSYLRLGAGTLSSALYFIMGSPLKFGITAWLIYRLVIHLQGRARFFPQGFPHALPWYGKIGLGLLSIEVLVFLSTTLAVFFPQWSPGEVVSVFIVGVLSYLVGPAFLMVEASIFRIGTPYR
jgi:hypothetical protein